MFKFFTQFLSQIGGGLLGTLTKAVDDILDDPRVDVIVVSVSGNNGIPFQEFTNKKRINKSRNMSSEKIPSSSYFKNSDMRPFFSRNDESFIRMTRNMHSDIVNDEILVAENLSIETACACVWISAKLNGKSYMSAVKLQGLLELQVHKVRGQIECVFFCLRYSRENRTIIIIFEFTIIALKTLTICMNNYYYQCKINILLSRILRDCNSCFPCSQIITTNYYYSCE